MNLSIRKGHFARVILVSIKPITSIINVPTTCITNSLVTSIPSIKEGHYTCVIVSIAVIEVLVLSL